MIPTKSVPATIRLVALREQYEQVKPAIDAAIASVIARSAFIGGPELEEFERWFADYCGVGHALGVASGTAALELVLRAHGVGPGDEVITPANTFIATAAAVSATGARPVFVDVDERTSNLDPATPERGDRTADQGDCSGASVRPAGGDSRDPRGGAGVPVIEDAAQAHGARCAGSSRRIPRDRRLLQLLSDQEPRRASATGASSPRTTPRWRPG